MIGTERATMARPHGRPDLAGLPLLDAMTLAEFEAEFFVEWQVAETLPTTPEAGHLEK